MSAFPASAKEKVFDDRVLSGENVDIDDFTFIITMNKYGNAIFIDAGTLFQTVPLFGCEKMETFEICFKNTTYDEEENELYAEVNITRSEPDVTVTRTMNITELYVGQEIEVEIVIENTGDTAPQIEMVDDYPAGSFEIYDIEGAGCRIHENQVYWKGHLDEDESKVCNFILKPLEKMERSFVAHVKYWDGYRWQDDYSSTLTLTVDPVLEVFTGVVKEDFEIDGREFDFEEDNPVISIGETLQLIINVTNNYDDDVDVEAFEIKLPPDLKYRSTGFLRFNYVNSSGNRSSDIWSSDRLTKIGTDILRWDGRITEGNSKLFIVKLEAERTGDQNLLIRTAYEYDDFNFEYLEQESLRVEDPGISIRMTLDDESKLFSAPERLDEEESSIDIESLHPYRLTVYTQNRNKYARLKDVKIEVLTDLAGFKDIRYTTIEEEGQMIPYSFILIPPQVDASTEYDTNISITFKNEYGEQHYNSTEFNIHVKPSDDMGIEWDSSEGEVLESDEETEIKVTIDNRRLVDMRDVRVTDIIPDELHVEGVHSKKVKLIADEETEVYTYRLAPPILHEKKRYNITTTVEFFDPDLKQTINFTEITTITVEPFRPELGFELNLDEPEDNYPGTMIPAEYTITNKEEEEIIREIRLYFPVQENVDLIGPKTFLIDKLDPGEEVVLRDLIRYRPKEHGQDLFINMTLAEYHDDYGNIFYENASDETIEVEKANINGPSVYLRTLVPDVINLSTDDTVRLEVKNNGSSAADVSVTQGDQSWNISVNPRSNEIITYTVRYDEEGNFSLPKPYASFGFQGLQAHTIGRGANVTVKLILGPGMEEEVKEAVVEPVEEIEKEKEEMSFLEYDEQVRKKQLQVITKYGLMGIIVVIVMVLIIAYIEYQRRKAPTAPFMGEGGTPPDEEEKS